MIIQKQLRLMGEDKFPDGRDFIMEKKEVMQKLAERKKMFEDYLEQVKGQPRLQTKRHSHRKAALLLPRPDQPETRANTSQVIPAKPLPAQPVSLRR